MRLRKHNPATRARPGSRQASPTASIWQIRPLVWMVGLLILAYALIGGYALLRHQAAPWRQPISAIRLDEQEVRVEVEALEPEQLYVFSFPPAEGERLPFVLQRDKLGVVRAGLATCRTCAASLRAHYRDGQRVICGRCGHPMRVPQPSQKTVRGCDLVRLPYSQEDGQITIRAEGVRRQTEVLSR